MKKITLLFIAVASSGLLFGQAAKKVIVEDETGTWCGYCPRGRTVSEDIENTYPNAITIANHNGGSDTYQNTYTQNLDNAMNAYGYPGGMVDRYFFSGQTYVCMVTSVWKSKTANRLLSTTPVSVVVSSSYDIGSRLLSVTVKANFVANAAGDMRISCVLEEDSIVNTSDPQENYMGNGCSSPDPSSPWYNYPCQISNYIQRDVVRANLAPDFGTAGVIPASVTSGQNFSQSYTYTLPSSWDANHMSIVGFVSYYNTSVNSRSILNAAKVYLQNTLTSVHENAELNSIEVKQNIPNPFKNSTALRFTLNTTDNVSIKVYNAFGQVVNDLIDSKLVPGEHTFYWAGDDNDGNTVAGGAYYYTISTSTQQITKPMVFVGQ
ncbi:MAG: Omp28-related outer membrane protein [Bacteroidetes bacterium]|nr:Omp28-related outer membrane protein [Bacteroidota bacterium]